MINWLVRFKNKNFWISFIPAALLLVQVVAALFGFELELGDIGDRLLAVVNALFAVLALLGVVQDPTTAGVSDSVQAMSVDMPGLVQTSLNFGIVKLKDSELYCANTVRSSMTSQKLWILDKVASIACLAGAKCEVSGSYPGWSYNPRSAVKDTILSSYKELFGRDATVEAVHAGIECGLFADSIPELDCVSIGPEMGDVHTPREHLSVSSAARTYELLKAVLGKSF